MVCWINKMFLHKYSISGLVQFVLRKIIDKLYYSRNFTSFMLKACIKVNKVFIAGGFSLPFIPILIAYLLAILFLFTCHNLIQFYEKFRILLRQSIIREKYVKNKKFRQKYSTYVHVSCFYMYSVILLLCYNYE